MKWAVILLNWNAARQTAEAVRDLRRWTRLKPDLCLVDNGSRESDRADLVKFCPDERRVLNPRNLGYAGGLNAAFAALEPQGYEAFLILNTDARLAEADAEQLLAAFAAHPRLGIVGPLLAESDGRRLRLDAGGRNIAFHLHTRRSPRSPLPLPSPVAPPVPIPVDYVPGTAALIRAKALSVVGPLDEAYFFSGEIADWCARAHRAGFECAVLPGARAEHTLEHQPLRDTLYLYYSLRNRFRFLRRFYPRLYPLLAVYWIALGSALAGHALLTGRFRRLRPIGFALRDGLVGRFGCHHEYFIPT